MGRAEDHGILHPRACPSGPPDGEMHGMGTGTSSPLLSTQSYFSSCCIQFPGASEGEVKRRDERRRNTQDNPEEIRLLEAARWASFTSLFSISFPSSEIIAEISPPPLFSTQYLIENADL